MREGGVLPIINMPYYGNNNKGIFIFQKIGVKQKFMVILFIVGRERAKANRDRNRMMVRQVRRVNIHISIMLIRNNREEATIEIKMIELGIYPGLTFLKVTPCELEA